MLNEKPQTNSYSKIARDLPSIITAGTTVAYTTFPAESIKKYLQSGYSIKEFLQSIRTGEFKLYRGSAVFAANVIPTTGIQFITKTILDNYMPAEATFIQKVCASAFSGVAGAINATFVENSIIRQQVLKSGIFFALQDMYQQGGIFRPWKSYNYIATRDGIFTMTMFCILPEVKKYMQRYDNVYAEKVANFGVCMMCAVLSHPVDTIATNLQKTHENTSGWQIAKNIAKESGVKGFYKGFICRAILVTAFANVIPEVKKIVDQKFENLMTEDNHKISTPEFRR